MRFRVLSGTRLGYRGAVLVILGFVDLLFGFSLVDPTHDTLRTSAYQWRGQYAPAWVWGALWIAVGVVLFVGALSRHDEFPYAAAIGIKVLWGMLGLMSWAVGGVERGWVSTVAWGGFGLLIAVISSWPEPPRITVVMEDRYGTDPPDGGR